MSKLKIQVGKTEFFERVPARFSDLKQGAWDEGPQLRESAQGVLSE